jgi:hypothetical protein
VLVLALECAVVIDIGEGGRWRRYAFLELVRLGWDDGFAGREVQCRQARARKGCAKVARGNTR